MVALGVHQGSIHNTILVSYTVIHSALLFSVSLALITLT